MDSIAAAALVPKARAAGATSDEIEEIAFWWLVHITSTCLKGFFVCGMRALCTELAVLHAALGELRPALLAHLERLSFDLRLVAPSWYLTLFQRILAAPDVGPALLALGSARLEPTHVALGILIACEDELLGAKSFDDAARVLCGTVCASRTRRAPAGVLEHASAVVMALPSRRLEQLRAAEEAAMGPRSNEPDTPRSKKARRWPFWG